MGNSSSHHSVSSPASTSTSTSQPSSSNSSTKSHKHFHIHSNPFSHFHTHNRRTSSIEEHGSLLKNADDDIEEDDDGTYLLRRGSTESREEWLARKQIIASRIKGDGVGDVGVKMWKDYSIVDGKGRL
ncbi:uncharacterized protein EAF02_005990 [Botrytis sinoallii]|uniref:uncharacterized protein n=1 Tax=Botrytis sinoallii TaxID=1463999 RepID=UPI0018FFBE43|nr:uncharacterized protein EAF02_005990 [Botrytis sinoallii]KAF7882627.1 hypothetical protein EAF02_005990 [Botrytis sinoallii]